MNNTLPEIQPSENAQFQHQSILIVDDDLDQVEALAIRLRRIGYFVHTAFSGQEGLLAAMRHRPNLILLDLRLPDVDGLHICEQLVDAPETCSIPIIIVSGMERPDIVRSTRAAGGHYFIRKPYDPNVLLTLIQRALEAAGDDW